MQVMTGIRLAGLGIALMSVLGGSPLFAADKPLEDGSQVVITSPQDGEKVGDTFDLKYELTKGSQAAHAHVYLDDQYQKGFGGTFKGISKGKHEITVTGATKDHGLVAASQSIHVEVQ